MSFIHQQNTIILIILLLDYFWQHVFSNVLQLLSFHHFIFGTRQDGAWDMRLMNSNVYVQTRPFHLNHYYSWLAVVVIQMEWPGLYLLSYCPTDCTKWTQKTCQSSSNHRTVAVLHTWSHNRYNSNNYLHVHGSMVLCKVLGLGLL